MTLRIQDTVIFWISGHPLAHIVTLRLLHMPAQIVQMMAFPKIMAIWTSQIPVWDHLKFPQVCIPVICIYCGSTQSPRSLLPSSKSDISYADEGLYP